MKLRAARLRYLLMSLLIFVLAACATDVQEPLTTDTDQTKVDEIVALYSDDPEGKFIENLRTLNTAEMELWIEGVYKSELAAFEKLEANPYAEKEVLKESGLPLDNPSAIAQTPDGISERIDAEGVEVKRVKLSAADLAREKQSIESAHRTRTQLHELAVDNFGSSINKLSATQWDSLDDSFARTDQGLAVQQACQNQAGRFQGGTPFVGRTDLPRTLRYVGTVLDDGDCDYLYRASGGSSSISQIAQIESRQFNCIARIAGLINIPGTPVGPVRSYKTYIYTGSFWYILGPKNRIDLLCSRNVANFSASARVR